MWLSVSLVLALWSVLSEARLEIFDYQTSFLNPFLKFYKEIAYKDVFQGLKFKTGYINVEGKRGHLFYIIVPKDQETGKLSTTISDPWSIWLQGGPGCASDFAFLVENGPFTFDKSGNLIKNQYSWHLLSDMIWVDQPAGTGFSSVENICGYVTSENEIAFTMVEFFDKILFHYPEFKNRPLYITGESYAGHYVPSIAWNIVKYPQSNLNLAGIAIGNGWVDPVVQYPAYATFAYQKNLIGTIGYQLARKALEQCVKLIENKATILAIIQCGSTVNAILGKLNPYDVRLKCEVPPLCYNETVVEQFLNKVEVQHQLGITTPMNWEDCNSKVHMYLMQDMDTETRTKLTALVENNYKVLIYNGVEDFICNWMGTDAWIKTMQWTEIDKFNSQQPQKYILDDETVGDYKSLNNFSFVKIYDAGHMVPMDQPKVAFHMMQKFLYSNGQQTNNKKHYIVE